MYLGTKNMILSWKLETYDIEGDWNLGSKCSYEDRQGTIFEGIIFLEDSPRRKSWQTTFRAGKDEGGVEWEQRQQKLG